MFRNGARESLPESWNHDRVCQAYNAPPPPTHLEFKLDGRWLHERALCANADDRPLTPPSPPAGARGGHPFIPDHLVVLQPSALPAPSPARQAGIGLEPADIVVRVLPPVFWLRVPAGFTEDSDFNSIPQHFIAPSDARHPKASDFLGDALYFYLDVTGLK